MAIAEVISTLRDDYEAKLTELAKWCREQNAESLAIQVETWAHQPSPRYTYVFGLPRQAEYLDTTLQKAAGDHDIDADVLHQWKSRFQQLRRDRASALFQLAEEAAQAGAASQALTLANEALREDPDHAAARKLFGYVRQNDEWLTTYEQAKTKAGQIWDKRFGWIAKEDLPRYESGQRRNRSLWVSAERDAQIHRNIDNGWRVQTEHFAITTNHSLEAGVALGERLESLYEVWRHVFADYYLSAGQIKGSFARGKLSSRRLKFRVMYFATEDDFRRVLARELPTDVKTTGVYLTHRKTSYFYHATPEDPSTQIHEATHQLFQEMLGRTQLEPGREANFWLVEGIACYMESLREHEPESAGEPSYWTTGGSDATRLQDARYYLFRESFQEPLADLSALGRTQFQRHPHIRRVYAQGAALADMLMHAADGTYRQALMAMLTGLYQGRGTSLSQLTEQSYAALDELYVKHMEATKTNGEHVGLEAAISPAR